MSVYRLLKHFESHDLSVEHIIKLDNKIQISEFFDEEMVHPHKWTYDALYEIGKLAARLHSSAEKFIVTEADIWKPWYLREIGGSHRI